MVTYKCTNCCKIYENKAFYTRHINRKFPCKKQEDTSTQYKTLVPYFETYANNTDTEFICEFCNKKYSRKDVLSRHLKNNCKVKKQENEKEDIFKKLIIQLEKQSEETEKLKIELRELKEKMSISQTINNTINNTHNGDNIIIAPHGRENLNKIKECDVIKALTRGSASVPIITELIHYNIQYPEFQNIYIPNINQKYCMIYDGINWLLKDKDDVIDSLYSLRYGFLEGKFEEFYEKLTNSQQNAFNRFIELNEKAEENEDALALKVIMDIKKELKLMLYNKRKMISKK